MQTDVLAEGGVIDALRRATRSHHAQLAASEPMLRLFDPAYTVAEYRAHLGRLLGLFEPLERAAAQASDPFDSLPGLHRASALRADLVQMGAAASDIDALERCGHVPSLELAGLRGYTYVMLGSMLGGKIIVKRLRAVLGQTASFHFYGDGDGRSEALWASFCSDVEANGQHDVPANLRDRGGHLRRLRGVVGCAAAARRSPLMVEVHAAIHPSTWMPAPRNRCTSLARCSHMACCSRSRNRTSSYVRSARTSPTCSVSLRKACSSDPSKCSSTRRSTPHGDSLY